MRDVPEDIPLKINMLQDCHIHLQDAPEEADTILVDAELRGVGRFFCNGIRPPDWKKVRSLADSHESIVPFFGVHPWHAGEAGKGWAGGLVEYLKSPGARIGEIGLDAAKKDSDFNIQRAVFARQLDIAVEMKKSVAIHCVQAWDELLEELKSREGLLPPFMMHWFSGSPEIAAELIKRGAYISFSPRLLYERAKKHRAVFAAAPVGRILLETDYPYTPEAPDSAPPGAAKYFEWLSSLYGIAARMKGISDGEFEKRIWENGTVFLH
ncbi:MAG: TatD family hydrolase [Candidatus Omnitrophica bacterium]|nr:TatD family hydrolase [Candidatus Omnitrophota bacterium]